MNPAEHDGLRLNGERARYAVARMNALDTIRSLLDV
jgi:hypothetical protein